MTPQPRFNQSCNVKCLVAVILVFQLLLTDYSQVLVSAGSKDWLLPLLAAATAGQGGGEKKTKYIPFFIPYPYPSHGDPTGGNGGGGNNGNGGGNGFAGWGPWMGAGYGGGGGGFGGWGGGGGGGGGFGGWGK